MPKALRVSPMDGYKQQLHLSKHAFKMEVRMGTGIASVTDDMIGNNGGGSFGMWRAHLRAQLCRRWLEYSVLPSLADNSHMG